MPLPDKASADEARTEAKLIPGHWKLFLVKLCCSLARAVSDHDQHITADEATKLRESNPNITWKNVPDDVKNQIIGVVNTELEKENIHAVDLDVIKWRMKRALDGRKYEGTYAPPAPPPPPPPLAC